MEAAALAKPMGTPVSGPIISRIVNIHIGPMPLPVFAATALVASIAVAWRNFTMALVDVTLSP